MADVKRFPMIERAIKELIETKYEPAKGHTGGDLAYEGHPDLYVWIGLVPGAGSTDETEGDWTVDIDCFAPTYGAAMDAALDIEALLLARRHVTSIMRLDGTMQNAAPAERPWDDESVSRVGATYSFSARRA